MAKRNRSDEEDEDQNTPKRARRTQDIIAIEGTPSKSQTTPIQTPSKYRSILKVNPVTTESITPLRSIRKVLFTDVATPQNRNGISPADESPITKANNLDRSARRKSNNRLLEQLDNGDDDFEGLEQEEQLAEDILNDEEAEDDSDGDESIQETALETTVTPTKTGRPRGRPKGKRKERTPSPPPDIPPHELYFFHNRTGGAKTSNNVLSADALLDHEKYNEKITTYTDSHASNIKYLSQLHQRYFDQWIFELECNFSLCLYGYGSKRQLVNDFAKHIHQYYNSNPPTIMIVNGYNELTSLKSILSLLCSILLQSSRDTAITKIPTNPSALLEFIINHFSSNDPSSFPEIYLIIHSLDSSSLRKSQSAIARLASCSKSIHLISTVDTPLFPILWSSSLQSQFRFLYHDTTTFIPYDGVEVFTVDKVNTLLNKSGRKVVGKDGVTFVLRSLPENARKLFRILILAQLTIMEDMGDDNISTNDHFNTNREDDDDDDELLGTEFDEDDDDEDMMQVDAPSKTPRTKKQRPRKNKSKKKTSGQGNSNSNNNRQICPGVEYRSLYLKASEEFVCTSEMSFRTLLKEFYDHRIVESRRDGGEERLIIPFSKGDLQVLAGEIQGMLGE